MKKEKNEDYCSVPMSIYMLGSVLVGVSSFQYFNNTALRKFTLKTLQNKIIPITTFKDAMTLRFTRQGFINTGYILTRLTSSQSPKSIPKAATVNLHSFILK